MSDREFIVRGLVWLLAVLCMWLVAERIDGRIR
jgi:hypothetical protein